MARSGTTFTTHLLFSCKEFASLQYKDIPFYKIIILWSFFNKFYYGFERFNKRIHGDELKISFNSPDAFEELIWKSNLNNYLNSGFFEKLDDVLTKGASLKSIEMIFNFLKSKIK